MNQLKTSFSLIAMFTLLIAGVGCKAGPAKNAGFVDAKVMKHDASLPFHLTWVKPGFDKSKYTKIYVAPVNTHYLLEHNDWQKGDRKKEFPNDVATIGQFTENAVKKAFKDDPKHRMTVIDSPAKDAETLTLEIALVEVVPSKVVLNALGYAPFFIGTGITAVRAIAQDSSTAAFEARFRDAGTGETVMMFADREAEQMAVVTVRGLTWYSHLQSIASQWASQFVAVMNQKPGEVIKDSDTFTVQPW